MINKILAYIWLVGLFISPVFGQEFGSAVINSVPDSADVYIDGYHFGKTPFEATLIMPGTYKVSLSKAWFETRVLEMKIEGEELFSKDILLFVDNSNDTLLSLTEKSESDVKKDSTNVRKPPELKKHMKVKYPRYIKYYGVEGKVYLHILIGCDGKPEKAAILKSSGAFCLDYEAIKAVPSLLFEPGIDIDGKPFRVWITYPVTFVLNR